MEYYGAIWTDKAEMITWKYFYDTLINVQIRCSYFVKICMHVLCVYKTFWKDKNQNAAIADWKEKRFKKCLFL